MPGKWWTQAEYAARHGISRSAVRQAVKAGRLESNGKSGHACRVRGALAETAKLTVPKNPQMSEAETAEYTLRMQLAKIAKLEADVELSRQRLLENRCRQYLEFAALIAEVYNRCFTPIRARLAEMRLTAEQLSALQSVIAECTANFERNVKTALGEHLKQEDTDADK